MIFLPCLCLSYIYPKNKNTVERKGRARVFLLVFTFLAFFCSQKIESSDKSEPVSKQDECALGNFEVKVTSCFGFNLLLQITSLSS